MTLMIFDILSGTYAQDSLRVLEKEPTQLDFVYSYYEQDGINSPVTGGIGDERLDDNVYKVSVVAPIDAKWALNMSGGIDIYTSASTDNINNEYDQYVETSASYRDARKYGSIGVSKKNIIKNTSISLDGGFSTEWDVKSFNLGFSFQKETNQRNTAYSLTGSYFHDSWELIYPDEFRLEVLNSGTELLDQNVRQLYNVGFSVSQILSPKANIMFSAEGVYIEGLLSTPFHRVYFADSITHDIERLPNSRLKIPLAIQTNVYLTDFLIGKFKYRFYWDDFAIVGHTFELEFPMKPFVGGTSFFRVIPFYRYHTQSAAKYFGAFATLDGGEDYYTSDYDLSSFQAHKAGLGIKYSPARGIINIKGFQMKKIEIRSAKYFKYVNNQLSLNAFIVTSGITFIIK